MNEKLVVTSISSYPYAARPQVKLVTKLFNHWGYDYRPYVDPLWQGFASKLHYMASYAESLIGEATHVLFTDSSDVIPLYGPDRLMDIWHELGHPWIFCAEPHIWPEESFQHGDYPAKAGGDWKNNSYLNSGCYLGEVEHIAKWFAEWTWIPILRRTDDQEWMTGKYIEHYPDAIKLDMDCKIFLCECGNAWNMEVTPGRCSYGEVDICTSHPGIVHFNGGSDILTQPEAKTLWEGIL